MLTSSYFPLLKSVPVLNTSVLQHAVIKKYKARETILSLQDMLFYIVKGTIRLFLDELKGNRKIIFLTEPGNFVFEANFFHSSDINATAEALTDVELAVFPKEKVFFLLSAKALAFGGEMVENSYSNDVLRLLTLLNELADEDNVVHITQTELAMMCGVHRVTINRWCQVLKNQNLIEIERNKIILMEKSDTKQSR